MLSSVPVGSESQSHAPRLTLSERPADANSRRAALCLVVLSGLAFLGLAPVAGRRLPQADWFIPLFQSVLVINDLVTAALLLGQLRLTRHRSLLVLACGYVFAAAMATLHLLTFPGVFSPTGLLGAGAQSTGYLHVFWHLGLPVAVLAYAFLRERPGAVGGALGLAVTGGLAVVALLAAGLTLLATLGSDLLPPMLAGNRYSSAFNIGRYGQWVLTGLAAVVLWRRRLRSVLDLWLVAMLCCSFFEIGLVSIFNAGRWDVGFYAGRVYAVLASSVVLVMLLGEQGKVYRELATAQETARSEAALRESHKLLGLAMHGGRMAAWTRDPATGQNAWTAEVQELTGWPAATLAKAEAFLERVHPDGRGRVIRLLEAGGIPEQEFAVEFRMRHARGDWRWLDCRGQALLDEDGKIGRLVGVVVDVTERKQGEEAVTRILESITDGFFAVDHEWRFTYVNQEAERLLQRRRDELLGRTVWAEFPEAVGATFQQHYERAVARQETVQFEEYFGPLGIWVEVRAYPSADGLSVYFRDVTARRQAEERLRESEERYRLVADMIPQFIWATEPDGYHNYFSRRWYEYTGTTPGDTHGEAWMDMLHPDDKPRMQAAWHHSLRTGDPYKVEYRFRGADGVYRWFMGQAEALRNDAGQIVRWFGTLTDISERKQHDQEREALLASEREAREEAERRRAELERVTESRSRLMRGFSHDLRNPLAAADGNAMLLEDGRAFGALNERQQESVRRIRRGIRSSLRLIDDLLELAQAEAGQIQLQRLDIELAPAAREIAEDFQGQASAVGLAIEVRVPDGLRASADPLRVRQIVGNLVSNAVKYAPQGKVTIAAAIRSFGGPLPGDWIALSVSDTGPGIPEDKRELIFEEYTRLQPEAQQGAGIGLAISRRIARLMGGDLGVESEMGRGSTFTLWLPASGPRRPAPHISGSTRQTTERA